MSYENQDPVIRRLVCERHELQRNLSLIDAELDRYSGNLRNLASGLDRVVSEGESSDAQGAVFTQLSSLNPDGLRKLLVERSTMLMKLTEIAARIPDPVCMRGIQ